MIENSKKQEWSRSTEADGMTKRINVRETDNNKFTVRLSVNGYKAGKKGEENWINKEKEYALSTNPLAEKDDSFEKSIKAIEDLVSDDLEF
jgi:hypothetical protein